MQEWKRAFLVTLMIELPVVCLLLKELPLRARVVTVLLANGISHPLLWFLMPRSEPFYLALAIGEVGVVGIELAVYRSLIGKDARFASVMEIVLIANVLSCGIGLLWWI
jgi:hypothetical protein